MLKENIKSIRKSKGLSQEELAIKLNFVSLILLNSPYLNWNYSNPESAVLGVAFHSFEWLFIRIAPIILIGLIIGIFLTRKKD